MKDQINTVREALLDARSLLHDGRRQDKALTALTQLEAMVGEQEPVAWAMPKGDGTFIDVITPAEHARDEGSYTVPLFAHPVAQQPTFDARRALEAIEALLSNIRRDAPSLSGKVTGFAEEVAAALHDKVAQQPQAEPDWINGVPHWSPALVDKVKRMAAELDETKQPQAEAVPPGYVLVPVEPTDEMLKAAAKACDDRMYPADMRHGPRAQNTDRYRAMIEAAQKGRTA